MKILIALLIAFCGQTFAESAVEKQWNARRDAAEKRSKELRGKKDLSADEKCEMTIEDQLYLGKFMAGTEVDLKSKMPDVERQNLILHDYSNFKPEQMKNIEDTDKIPGLIIGFGYKKGETKVGYWSLDRLNKTAIHQFKGDPTLKFLLGTCMVNLNPFDPLKLTVRAVKVP